MIPALNDDGNLPPGVHWATWDEIYAQFGGTERRRELLAGLGEALAALHAAGCSAVYVDGSFVTSKEHPADFDGCWDMTGVDPVLLDPVLLDFANGRAKQKAKYMGELFPSTSPSAAAGPTFLEFFQTDKNTGSPKGIIAIDLRRLG